MSREMAFKDSRRAAVAVAAAMVSRGPRMRGEKNGLFISERGIY